jgi:hypothetical protein
VAEQDAPQTMSAGELVTMPLPAPDLKTLRANNCLAVKLLDWFVDSDATE